MTQSKSLDQQVLRKRKESTRRGKSRPPKHLTDLRYQTFNLITPIPEAGKPPALALAPPGPAFAFAPGAPAGPAFGFVPPAPPAPPPPAYMPPPLDYAAIARQFQAAAQLQQARSQARDDPYHRAGGKTHSARTRADARAYREGEDSGHH